MINQIEEAYRENRDSWNEDHLNDSISRSGC